MTPPRQAAVALLLAATARQAAATEIPLDDFDGGTAGWTFTNGPEFPGATGALDAGAGYAGPGLALSYDFSDGGHYVGVQYALPTPLDAAAIGFWAQMPPGASLLLRVVDQTDQTLVYAPNRPLSAMATPEAWFRDVIELDVPAFSYGGAADNILHEPIQAIAILVSPLAPVVTAAGTVRLDEVVAETDLDLTLDPAAPLDPPYDGGPALLGDLPSNLGVNIHSDTDPIELGIANDAGFIWVRTDLAWSTVETTPGVYDFSVYDGLLSLLEADGMKALFVLDYTNPLYDGNAPPTSDAGVAAFAAFAGAAASHLAGHGVRYEVWNEENGGFWAPAPDALAYAPLARATIAAVHAADPTALVTTGGLAGFDFAFLQTMLDAGAAVGADAVGVHPYTMLPPETLTDQLVLMRAMVGALPNHPDVWDTEWGYTPGNFDATVPDSGPYTAADFDEQERYIVRELIAAKAVGFSFPILYEVLDDCENLYSAGCNFGLLSDDGHPTPALAAVTTFTKLAAGRSWRGFLRLVPSTVFGLRLDGSADSLIILWNSLPGSAVSVTLPANVACVDMVGQPLSTLALDGGRLFTLNEAIGPVYLSAPLPATTADAGPVDAGMDAGMDAGTVIDAGAIPDAGLASDAGSQLDGGAGTTVAGGGCHCGAGGAALDGLPFLVVLWLRRRCKRDSQVRRAR